MAVKYYRVLKDTPLWKKGAILENTYSSGKGYHPTEDIWWNDAFEGEENGEYLSAKFIEKQPEWFERVYKSTVDKMLFLTKQELTDLYDKAFKK